MKRILLLLILSTVTAFSGVVTVTESARVTLDGVDIGAIPDAIKNGVVTPGEVQSAVVALIAKLKAESSAKEAERVKIEAAARAKLAVAEKLKAAFEQGDAEKFAEASAELESAKTPEKEKRLAEIAARDVELQAEQAKLAVERAALEAKASTPKAKP